MTLRKHYPPSHLNLQHKKHFALLLSLTLTAPIIFFQGIPIFFSARICRDVYLDRREHREGEFYIAHERPTLWTWRHTVSLPTSCLVRVCPGAQVCVIPTWFYLVHYAFFFMIPLYFLVLELFESKVASFLAVVLAITQPAVYYTHVWSAGSCRMALFFCLTGLLFYVDPCATSPGIIFFLPPYALDY